LWLLISVVWEAAVLAAVAYDLFRARHYNDWIQDWYLRCNGYTCSRRALGLGAALCWVARGFKAVAEEKASRENLTHGHDLRSCPSRIGRRWRGGFLDDAWCARLVYLDHMTACGSQLLDQVTLSRGTDRLNTARSRCKAGPPAHAACDGGPERRQLNSPTWRKSRSIER